jgi:hypothetical protein
MKFDRLMLLHHYKKLAFFWRCNFSHSRAFYFHFPTFSFSFYSFQKSQKRNSVKEKENENDETLSGSASVETVCNLRLGRLTQNRPSPQ